MTPTHFTKAHLADATRIRDDADRLNDRLRTIDPNLSTPPAQISRAALPYLRDLVAAIARAMMEP